MDSICNICGAAFTSRINLNKHMRRIHQRKTHTCAECGKTFSRSDNLYRHEAIHKRMRLTPDNQQPSTSTGIIHNPIGNLQRELDTLLAETNEEGHTNRPCNWCGKLVKLIPGKSFCEKCGDQGVQCRDCGRPMPQRFYTSNAERCNACCRKRENQTGRGSEKVTALEGLVSTHTLEPASTNKLDILIFFKENETPLMNILNTELDAHNGLKWNLVLSVRLVRYTTEGDEITTEPCFRSLNSITTNSSQFQQAIADAYHRMYTSFQTFQMEGSGWVLDEVVNMQLNVAKYNPLRGSTYIPTPQALVKKMALVNVKNSDDYCFAWSVLAALHPVKKDPNRIQHYKPYFNSLNLKGLKFPLTLDQVSKFESQNSLSVNVFGYEDGVFPLRITSNRCDRHINLLLISQGNIRHYCLIKSMSRLLGDRTKYNGQTFFCDYCLHPYCSKALLDDHLPNCSPMGMQRTVMPEEKILKFKNIRNQLRVPFVIYADFECFTHKTDNHTAQSTRYEEHKPSSFCYTVVCKVPRYTKPPVVYRGPNVVETFLHALLKENDYICNILKQIHPMIISDEQIRAFQTATHCHICDNPLGADRVKDHCHISGIYRGPAHNECNLQYRFCTTTKEDTYKFFIPCVFHNGRNYDTHLLIEAVGKLKNFKITCIPNNMQKYISFSVGNIRFIDSLQFLNASLDTLVSNMAKDSSNKFCQLMEHFPQPQQHKLLLRKGVFPYAYMTDPSKFGETRLPPKESFYNDLKEEALSPDDYAHAQAVWKELGMKNLGDYQDLYIKTDVLLLADIFENFRDICLAFYNLDPLHYYTSPGLSWDAMLKMTGVQLELLQDIDMHLMVERGLRGGISVITTKYAKANNPYLDDYNPCLPTSYITYLDANNLYGWAMSQSLPLKDFAWLTEEQIKIFDVLSIPNDAHIGYMLEVDLQYPAELHETHNCYPLCAERMAVRDEMLSDYSMDLKRQLNIKGKPTEKLVPNLFDKFKYVIHYRELKFCLAQGMILKKIHRGIEFIQSAWLEPYIDFNTSKRKQAKNDFEKDFFKLMNNAVFGKTMENLRKRSRIELLQDSNKLEKLIAKPSFHTFKIFNQDLCGVEMKKLKLVLNRPIYVGFAILDISKILMYDFHYNYMRPKYGENLKLLFTDTDSLCYFIECKDIYNDMAENLNLFDTSNYSKDHLLFSQANAKVLGKMKDETAGEPISEFVGLRPKMYSMTFAGQEKKTAKGIAKYVVKKKLRHEQFKQSLFDKKQFTASMNCIRSFDHNLYSVRINKIGLSPFDDKRYVLSNGVDTLAHGHCQVGTVTSID